MERIRISLLCEPTKILKTIFIRMEAQSQEISQQMVEVGKTVARRTATKIEFKLAFDVIIAYNDAQ